MINNLLLALVVIIACFIAAEGVLRSWPELISLRYLQKFTPDVSVSVANSRGLVTQDVLHPLPRDDQGPPLHVYRSNATLLKPADPEDRQFGAVELHTSDANGLCNTAVPDAVSAITLGDSFTYCSNVQPIQSWTARLGTLMRTDTYNISRPKIGLYEYIQFLKHFGIQLKPSVVIMAVYEGNDLRDAAAYWESVENGGSSAQQGEPADLGLRNAGKYVLEETLLGKSYAVNLVAAGIWDLTTTFMDRFNSKDDAYDFTYTVAVNGRRISMNINNTDLDEIHHAYELANDNISLSMWDQALASLVDLANANNFTPVVTYLPSAYTAYEDSVEFSDSEVASVVRDFSRRQRSYLESNAQRFGYVYIDVSEALSQYAAEAPDLLYFPSNVHLTAEGHAAVAEILSSKLADLNTALLERKGERETNRLRDLEHISAGPRRAAVGGLASPAGGDSGR